MDRWFLMQTATSDFEIVVNPRVTRQSALEAEDVEGCLSLDGQFKVKRPFQIHVEYQDADLNKKRNAFQGMEARVFLHELDHLDGRLICDHGVPV